MNADEHLLSRYLDGDLEPAEAERLIERLREDPALRQELERLEGVDRLLADLGPGSDAPDDALSRRVMARISTLPPPEAAEPAEVKALPRRRAYWIPLAMAASLALGILVGRGGSQEVRPSPGEPAAGDRVPDLVLVHLVLEAPEARTVSVVGSFNSWKGDEHPMKLREGRWIARMELPRGRHEYQFLVDGERWIVDPAARRTIDDGFGGKNGVLEL